MVGRIPASSTSTPRSLATDRTRPRSSFNCASMALKQLPPKPCGIEVELEVEGAVPKNSHATSSRCGEVLRAELLEARGLEALVGDRGVARELLAVRHVLRGGDLVERLPVERRAHRPLRRRAEERPADVRLHQPREVAVQRRDLRVGARVREVDRVPDAVLAQRLARVEVPAEERVDRQRDVAQELRLLGGDEVLCPSCSDRGAARPGRSGRVRLRPEADAAHEAVERVHRRLQVHDRLAALLVGASQRGLVVDLADALQPPPSYGFMNSG